MGIEINKYCKYCGKLSIKTNKGVNYYYIGICALCRSKAKLGMESILKKELEELHSCANLSVLHIADKFNTTVYFIRKLFKEYDIKEVHECKHCGIKDKLVTTKIINQFMSEPKIAIKDICKECDKKYRSIKIKEALSKRTKEEVEQQVEKIKGFYKENPDKKKRETEKAKETKRNNPEKRKKAIEKSKKTKRNWTEEQKEQKINKFLKTMGEKSEEEKQQRLKRMGEGVSKSLNKRTKEEIKASNKKREETCYAMYNSTCVLKHGGFSKKAYTLFKTIEKQNPEITFLYNRKKDKWEEKAINVEGITFTNSKVRFLDCYFLINNREICIEFDEKYHEGISQKEKDLHREVEITLVKPELEIYRVSEKLVESRGYEHIAKHLMSSIIHKQKNKNYVSLIEKNINNQLVKAFLNKKRAG